MIWIAPIKKEGKADVFHIEGVENSGDVKH